MKFSQFIILAVTTSIGGGITGSAAPVAASPTLSPVYHHPQLEGVNSHQSVNVGRIPGPGADNGSHYKEGHLARRSTASTSSSNHASLPTSSEDVASSQHYQGKRASWPSSDLLKSHMRPASNGQRRHHLRTESVGSSSRSKEARTPPPSPASPVDGSFSWQNGEDMEPRASIDQPSHSGPNGGYGQTDAASSSNTPATITGLSGGTRALSPSSASSSIPIGASNQAHVASDSLSTPGRPSANPNNYHHDQHASYPATQNMGFPARENYPPSPISHPDPEPSGSPGIPYPRTPQMSTHGRREAAALSPVSGGCTHDWCV